MTVLTSLRRARPASSDRDDGGSRLLPIAAGGALSALVGLVLTLMLVGTAGSLAARADLNWAGIFGFGAGIWLLAGGARLGVDQTTIAFTPLLATALVAGLALGGARRVLPRTGPRRRPWCAFVGGYAAVAGCAALLALAGPVLPQWWSLGWPVLGIPLLAVGVVEARRGRLEVLLGHLPRTVRRCVRPAVRVAGVAVVTGMLLTLLSVLAHWSRVSSLNAELRPGLFGGLALASAQVLAAPNLGLWALSFAAGPGFSLTEGTSVTLSGSESGVLPIVPVLGAVPGPGAFEWYTRLLLLIPVALGMYAARRALAEIPRLAGVKVKLAGVLTTILLAAALLTALDVLGGGQVGSGKLRHVGAPSVWLGLAMALAMSVGGLLVLARDWWRLRR